MVNFIKISIKVSQKLNLALGQVTKKWTMPIKNWGLILSQFMAIFENRIKP